MSDSREDSQGDRARLNARVERLEEWQDSARDLMGDLEKEQIRLRAEFESFVEKTAETAKSREKGGDRMFATALVVLSAVLSAVGAVIHLVKR